MTAAKLITTINKALAGDLPFNEWISSRFSDWKEENPGENFLLSGYAKYLGVELDSLLDWISTNSVPPTDPEIKSCLWEKYGFIYCFVADEAPPASVFPEGSSPGDIRASFEGLKFMLTSGEFDLDPSSTNQDIRELFSRTL